MIMPPYHGATIRVPEPGIFEFFARVRRDLDPDHDPGRAGRRHAAVGGVPRAHRARDRERRAISRSRCRGAAAKLRALIELGGDADRRPVGRRGRHHADGRPRRRRDRHDDRRRLSRRHPARSSTRIAAGRREEAAAAYARWLPLINYENRQCGLRAAQGADEGGRRDRLRRVATSRAPLHPATRAGLLEIARTLDPLVLRWAK